MGAVSWRFTYTLEVDDLRAALDTAHLITGEPSPAFLGQLSDCDLACFAFQRARPGSAIHARRLSSGLVELSVHLPNRPALEAEEHWQCSLEDSGFLVFSARLEEDDGGTAVYQPD